MFTLHPKVLKFNCEPWILISKQSIFPKQVRTRHRCVHNILFLINSATSLMRSAMRLEWAVGLRFAQADRWRDFRRYSKIQNQLPGCKKSCCRLKPPDDLQHGPLGVKWLIADLQRFTARLKRRTHGSCGCTSQPTQPFQTGLLIYDSSTAWSPAFPIKRSGQWIGLLGDEIYYRGLWCGFAKVARLCSIAA